MKAEPRTINDLFESSVRYIVPLYQRPYVWNEEDQWEPLWRDLRDLLDGGLSITADMDHFMGAIVLQDEEEHIPGSIPEFTVIDGQQRLTTLQLVLAAAAAVARVRGLDKEADILADLVRNNPKKATGDAVYKVWPTNQNRAAFRATVDASLNGAAAQADDARNTIHEAHAYFARMIHEWLEEEAVDDPGAAMTRLRAALTDQVQLVSITLRSSDNSQMIFETLNARGTPLQAMDLLKNAVFHDAQKHGVNTDHLYEDVWKPQLDDPYWRVERRQGRLTRPTGDLFLMHWLTMRTKAPVSATKLFPVFRKSELGQNRPQPVEALIRTICHHAGTYRSFDAFEPGTLEGEFVGRLEDLDTTVVYPVVLRLFVDASIAETKRRRALSVLESWLVRRAIMGWTSKSYNKFVVDWLNLIDGKPTTADDELLNCLKGYDGPSNKWPTDEEIQNELLQQPLYERLRPRRVAMVLRAVELKLREDPEDEKLSRKLSVEHVIPQGWNEKHWPLPANLQAEAAANERQRSIHLLGNLTLTRGRLNTGLSNKAWKEKQPLLNKKSVMLLNNQLIATYPEVFDEMSIVERGRDLTKHILSIWRGPAADW